MKPLQSPAKLLPLVFLSMILSSQPAQAMCAIGPMVFLAPSEKAERIAPLDRTSPYIPRSVESISLKERVSLVGLWFYEDCLDTGLSPSPPPLQPTRGIRIYFKQGSQQVQIGTVDANGENTDFSFVFPVSFPEGTVAGPAELITEWTLRGNAVAGPKVKVIVLE